MHQPLGLSAEQAIEQGEAFGMDHARYDQRNGQIQISNLIQKLGGTVCVEQVPEFNDLLYVYEEGRFRINVPHNTSLYFDKVSMARAIGHYQLHFIQARERSACGQQPRQAIFEKGMLSEAEKEANAFSMGLLLPSTILRKLIDDTHCDITEMAERVELPRTFIGQRIEVYEKTRQKNHAEQSIM